MAVTFDGDNLLIVLESGVSEIDAQVDLYSDWKEWFKTGTNSRYPVAFDTTGGDPVGPTQNVGRYFFLRNDNGWRIRPPEEDITINIIGGLYGRDDALDLVVPTVGSYTVLVSVSRSALALEISAAPAITTSQFLALR